MNINTFVLAIIARWWSKHNILESIRRFIVNNCNTAFHALCHAFEAMCGNCCCETGQITLSQGQHEVVITTNTAPSVVFLSAQPNDTPVCLGNIDMVGYVLLPNGFTLYANISSASAIISYIVKS